MMFVRLHDQLVELPSAEMEAEIDGRIAFSDGAGVVVAWFEKLDIIAFSENREQLHMEQSVNEGRVEAGRNNGHGI